MTPNDDADELDDTIAGALASLDEAYCHDEDGYIIPTTLITGPGGEIVAKFARGSKSPAEVQRLVDQFNQLHELPERDAT